MTPPPRQIPALDGLRAASIALVLGAHAGLGRVVPGGLGVTVFFFVSGLLITTLLLDEHDRAGRIALGRFYARRVLRLAPAATAYVAVSGAVFAALGGTLTLAACAAAILDVANLAELFTRSFDSTIAVPHPFVVLWSLAVEEHAYLIWPPLLAVLLSRFAGARRVALGVLALLCLASLAWRAELATVCVLPPHAGGLCGTHPDARIYKATDTRLHSIAFGAIAALLARGEAARARAHLRARFRARFRAWASVAAAWAGPASAAAASMALIATLVVRDPFFRETARPTVQGLSLLVLVPALIRSDNAVRRLLSTRVAVATGRLSYGLYLWHWLALMLATRVAPTGGPAFVAIFVLLTPPLAWLSWHLIEQPVVRLRRRLGSAAPDRLAPPVHDRRGDPSPIGPHARSA